MVGLGDNSNNKKNKKKKRGGTKRKMTAEQASAFKSVTEWVYLDHPNSSSSSSTTSALSSWVVDDFGAQKSLGRGMDKVLFELHSHSKHSDGFLSPSKLVERAHGRGVKVLALTDHDTMSGITEAVETARRFGIKIIPGVEISTIFSPRNLEMEEPVHILAYYSSCGPMRHEELEKLLANIREGRYLRAKDMVLKLNKLKLPLKWEHITKIAGNGVAPGRLHVARAMVEAGYVENLKQAFARYLYDGGPAYSTGSEPLAEEAVRLICETGGLAVLAHPWALKNPIPIIRQLKDAGLHGMEVYRSDGRLAAFNDLADTYELLKLGGSDYHGRGGNGESELGSVNLPVLVLHEFLKVARPIWCGAIKDILESYAKEPSALNLARIVRFSRMDSLKGTSPLSCGKDWIDRCLSSWLTTEEWQNAEFEAIRLKLSLASIDLGGVQVPIETK
ncbi:hyccin-like [Hibiscus syriacus]|uniref:Hyccin-like n=1 Tax=Hibiscus syriacus TaxID=106335 RepID=A0A6A2ZHX2_HIBSY|nr:5'-3' exoribonuclease-like [Hibiscus syriacus]XP_039014506.1 5'-3' exoribonuclease-like [Hibiscus syriacus]XP_039014507.1 5'-3' exoribonuclease-like [Hibiscus syriacus]KAE8691488.1 hyccin-like [Hibiscus syriacus]